MSRSRSSLQQHKQLSVSSCRMSMVPMSSALLCRFHVRAGGIISLLCERSIGLMMRKTKSKFALEEHEQHNVNRMQTRNAMGTRLRRTVLDEYDCAGAVACTNHPTSSQGKNQPQLLRGKRAIEQDCKSMRPERAC